VDTLRSQWISTGPKTKRFENEFAAFLRAPGALALNSCTAALHTALKTLGIGPGDEVITTPMTFTASVNVIEHVGARPVLVDVEPDTLNIDPHQVAAAITPRTRAILLGFPNNPTGAVLEKEDVAGIARLAAEHDLLVYADEIYDRLVYGTEHHSIVSQPEMKERTIYLAGFSKSYAMTGWRVGYACAPAEIVEQMMKIHQYTVMCVPTAAQYAALEALQSGEPEVLRMVGEYDARRQYMWRRFNEMGLHCFEPRGAFYCFPNITSTAMPDDDVFCEQLLKHERVVVVPGNAFGERGRGHVRACYAASLEQIAEACDRIERFVEHAAS